MKRRCGVILFVLAMALVAAALACTPAAPTPTPTPAITVTDDAGRAIALSQVPQRIVSLAPSNTEILFALGLGDKVVGVSDLSDYPPEAKTKPKVGGFKPSLESIVALNPDLVLVFWGGDIVGQLEGAKIAVAVLAPSNLESVFKDIELVGQLTGSQAKARELTAQMRQEVAAIKAITDQAPRPKVFVEVDATDPSKPWTVGATSFFHDLITLAGGQNIAAAIATAGAQMSAEEILRANPDLIILADAPYGVTAEAVKARAGWNTIAAVQKGAIYPLDDQMTAITNRPGPRLTQGLKELAKLIHPELFR